MLDEKVFAELAEMPATAPPLEELEGRVTRRRARRRIAAVGFALVVVLAMSAGALSLSARGNSPAAVVAAGGDAPSDLGQNLSCQTDSRAHGSADYSGEGGSATPQMAVTEYLRRRLRAGNGAAGWSRLDHLTRYPARRSDDGLFPPIWSRA